MENRFFELLYFFGCFLFLAAMLCLCLGGLWVVHSAINEGDYWKCAVGAIVAIPSTYIFIVNALGAFGEI